jgi:hypothetical protein
MIFAVCKLQQPPWPGLFVNLSAGTAVVFRRVCRERAIGQCHFGVDRREYKHDARASESGRKALTRLRFVPVLPAKVALSN